jgi:hypothetical protein
MKFSSSVVPFFLLTLFGTGCLTSPAREEAAFDNAKRTGVCHIHHTKMRQVDAPVKDDIATDARNRWFWHTRDCGAGCIVERRGSPNGKLWVCRFCERDSPQLGLPSFGPPEGEWPKRSFGDRL